MSREAPGLSRSSSAPRGPGRAGSAAPARRPRSPQWCRSLRGRSKWDPAGPAGPVPRREVQAPRSSSKTAARRHGRGFYCSRGITSCHHIWRKRGLRSTTGISQLCKRMRGILPKRRQGAARRAPLGPWASWPPSRPDPPSHSRPRKSAGLARVGGGAPGEPVEPGRARAPRSAQSSREHRQTKRRVGSRARVRDAGRRASLGPQGAPSAAPALVLTFEDRAEPLQGHVPELPGASRGAEVAPVAAARRSRPGAAAVAPLCPHRRPAAASPRGRAQVLRPAMPEPPGGLPRGPSPPTGAASCSAAPRPIDRPRAEG